MVLIEENHLESRFRSSGSGSSFKSVNQVHTSTFLNSLRNLTFSLSKFYFMPFTQQFELILHTDKIIAAGDFIMCAALENDSLKKSQVNRFLGSVVPFSNPHEEFQ